LVSIPRDFLWEVPSLRQVRQKTSVERRRELLAFVRIRLVLPVVTLGKASFRESLEQEEVRQMLYADRQYDAGESGSGHLAV